MLLCKIRLGHSTDGAFFLCTLLLDFYPYQFTIYHISHASSYEVLMLEMLECLKMIQQEPRIWSSLLGNYIILFKMKGVALS